MGMVWDRWKRTIKLSADQSKGKKWTLCTAGESINGAVFLKGSVYQNINFICSSSKDTS